MDELTSIFNKVIISLDKDYRKSISAKGHVIEWQKIIAREVRDYVLGTEPVSSRDVHIALARLPSSLRAGWLDYPKSNILVSPFIHSSQNRLILGSGVKSMTLEEAATITFPRPEGSVYSFNSSVRGRPNLKGVELFYRELDQVCLYMKDRFEKPQIIAKLIEKWIIL